MEKRLRGEKGRTRPTPGGGEIDDDYAIGSRSKGLFQHKRGISQR